MSSADNPFFPKSVGDRTGYTSWQGRRRSGGDDFRRDSHPYANDELMDAALAKDLRAAQPA